MNSESEGIEVYNNNTTVTKIIAEKVRNLHQIEPFFICDIRELLRKCSLWAQLFPRIKPFYAVKANSSRLVLKVMADFGINFDCASKYEMDLVLSLGMSPNRIIYAHSIKSSSYIKYASDADIKLMTFDNEEELRKMKGICPDVQAIIRIKCDAKNAFLKLGEKFGCDVENEADELIKLAQNLCVNLVGVSFHIGVGCTDPPSFYNAIKSARIVFDIAKRYGYHLRILDIGGGFPGADDVLVKQIALTVNNALDIYFSDQSIQIIAEPGTALVDSAFTLACNVISRKFKSNQWIYYINDGIYGSFNKGVVVGSPFTMYPLKIPSNKELYSSKIFGVTCGSKDKLIENLALPSLQIDDCLILKNMGAYSLGLHTSMNGFFVPRVFYVTDFNNLTRHGFSQFSHKCTETILKEATDDATINFNEDFSVIFCID